MTVRSKHLIAYASAMFALMVWQLVFYTPPFGRLSDFNVDVVYTIVSQILCMGIVPLVVLLILNKGKAAPTFERMRYKAPRDGKSCFLICIALIFLITPFTMVFNALTNLLFSILGYRRSYPIGTVYLGIGDFFLMLLLTGILPAVFEEFSHRGVLLSGLENRGSEMSAVILSSVMFGLMHGNPAQMIYATFGGLVFGVVVVKTDSIIPAMCAHFGNNAVSVILDYSTQKQTTFGVWYERLTSSASILSIGFTFLVLGLSVFAMVKLLQYAATKAPKPISEGKLLGVVTLDEYYPDGKATLKDNIALYPVMIAESALMLFLLVWGIVR